MSEKTNLRFTRAKKPPRKGGPRPGITLRPERMAWIVIPAVGLLVSILLFPSILSKPTVYRLGDVAARDIKASREFLVEDKDLTEKNREKAVKGVLSVYDYDGSASNLVSLIREIFNEGREYYAKISRPEDPEKLDASAGQKQTPGMDEDEEGFPKRFFSALEIPEDKKTFDLLLKYGFPVQIEDSIVRMIVQLYEKGIVANKAMMMEQIEKGGIVLHEISSQQEITVTDYSRFYDLEAAKRNVESRRKELRESMTVPELVDITLKLTNRLIKPNLTFNQRETEHRKDLARESIKPAYFKIKEGEMIVREGERIGPEHLLKLSGEINAQGRLENLSRVPGMAVLIAMMFSVIFLTLFKGLKAIKDNPRDHLFVLVLLLGMFLLAWAYKLVAEEVARGFPFFTTRSLLYSMPLALGAVLATIFQGFPAAVCFSLTISILASFISGGGIQFFIYFLIGSLVAAHGVRRCTERGILIKTGLKVGLMNAVTALAMETLEGTFEPAAFAVAPTSGFAGGLLVGIIATGILPLIEMSFGFTTDIKLLELSNLDQPLLRELMLKTPGTYHHSVIISNMVEATAQAVQANPLLARVSAYYHDIGKMKKPLYFIENQIEGINRHEKLAPSMSSLILISHVKDGIELAKKYKLGREICDIIQQHHGTTLISFFYQKAKDRVAQKGDRCLEVKEENFRYPGPKPQTKEAGLVMLADMVEAATRSLKDPTPSRIKGIVQKIVNKAFSDGQLDECELTLKDLHEIAKSFNKTLSGIFHQRVEYPDTSPAALRRGANGDTDQVSPEDVRGKKQGDQAETDEGLKRLGL